MTTRVGSRSLWIGAALAVPLSAWCQQAPDAGRILQEHRPPAGLPAPATAPGLQVEEPIRPALRAPEGVRFKVAGFRFSGNSAFAADKLGPLVSKYVGMNVSLSDLEEASRIITGYYREHGYFVARAYVPAQEIKDGVVEILVLEGRLGEVEIHPQGKTRIGAQYLDNMVKAEVPTGRVLREGDLERALLLMNDLPGINASATLSPSTQQARTKARIDVTEGPLLTGTLEFDNYGNKFTGANRPGAKLYVNDPSGIGDQVRLYYTGLADNQYYYAGYFAPLGARGLKGGLSYTYTNYHLCCDFVNLHATGRAEVAGGVLSYPFVRSRNANVTGTLLLEHKAFFNATLAGTTSDKTDNVATLSVGFDRRDSWLGGGENYATLSLVGGNLDLGGFAPDLALDQATARSDGSWTKAVLTAGRLQSLAPNWAVYGGLTAQAASKNLDSSEKISLGGPNGVRSYPQNEAPGDSGAIVTLELRHNLTPNFQLIGFADVGFVELHHQTWAGWQGANPGLRNNYSLTSGGVGAAYEKTGNFSLRAFVAQRLGNNPGQDVNGHDSDGGRTNTRLWFQAIKYL